KIDLKRSKSQSLDEENGPSPPLHKKQGFSNSLRFAAISSKMIPAGRTYCINAGFRLTYRRWEPHSMEKQEKASNTTLFAAIC
ncbi:MAG: hypothetical protein E6230_13640, partial [Paenibacillus dendritiformis]|nr:hypothetical protein [Paenibacillus dendritiformis]